MLDHPHEITASTPGNPEEESTLTSTEVEEEAAKLLEEIGFSRSENDDTDIAISETLEEVEKRHHLQDQEEVRLREERIEQENLEDAERDKAEAVRTAEREDAKQKKAESKKKEEQAARVKILQQQASIRDICCHEFHDLKSEEHPFYCREGEKLHGLQCYGCNGSLVPKNSKPVYHCKSIEKCRFAVCYSCGCKKVEDDSISAKRTRKTPSWSKH